MKPQNICILLNTTNAMQGDNMDIALQAIKKLKKRMSMDPFVIETVKCISAISVSENAIQIMPPTNIREEYKFKLNIHGLCCNLQNAFSLLLNDTMDYICLFFTDNISSSNESDILLFSNKTKDSHMDFFVCLTNDDEYKKIVDADKIESEKYQYSFDLKLDEDLLGAIKVISCSDLEDLFHCRSVEYYEDNLRFIRKYIKK